MIDLAADINNILAEIGQDVTIVDGGAVIKGMFVAPYEGVDQFTGQVATTAPTLQVASADVASLKRGDLVTVDEHSYEVVRTIPTGLGWTQLQLRNA